MRSTSCRHHCLALTSHKCMYILKLLPTFYLEHTPCQLDVGLTHYKTLRTLELTKSLYCQARHLHILCCLLLSMQMLKEHSSYSYVMQLDLSLLSNLHTVKSQNNTLAELASRDRRAKSTAVLVTMPTMTKTVIIIGGYLDYKWL